MARKRKICIPQPELTDEEWALLASHLPEPEPSRRAGPKPVPNRPVVEGILWILRNAARWEALPEGYPSPATCWPTGSATAITSASEAKSGWPGGSAGALNRTAATVRGRLTIRPPRCGPGPRGGCGGSGRRG